MKKEVLVFIFVTLLIFTAGVLAQESADTSNNEKHLTEKQINAFATGFVKDTPFVGEGKIQTIKEINQNELPSDLQIQDINENKLGIYEVNFSNEIENKKVYLVTYATLQLAKKPLVQLTKNIQNLFFGISTEQSISSYLETSSGVPTSEEIGYVMIRGGSITGISTTMEVKGTGKLFISVYKNGESTGFHNLITSEDSKKVDFDLQSQDIVTYKPGDIISVYIEKVGGISWNNVVTIVETTS